MLTKHILEPELTCSVQTTPARFVAAIGTVIIISAAIYFYKPQTILHCSFSVRITFVVDQDNHNPEACDAYRRPSTLCISIIAKVNK
jgi:hypothetical protein